MSTKLVALVGTLLAIAAVVVQTRQGISLEDSKPVDVKKGDVVELHLNVDDDVKVSAKLLQEIDYRGFTNEPRDYSGRGFTNEPRDYSGTAKEAREKPKGSKKIYNVPKESRITLPCRSSISTHYMERGDTVTFTSPRHPRKYPRKRNCGWRLQGMHSDITIGIECTYFRMENKRRGKCKDFLQLGSTKFCGRFWQRPIGWESSGNSVYMKFYSNRRRNYRGFRCIATAYGSYTTTTVTQSTTTNTAPSVDAGSCIAPCGIPNRSTKIVGGVATEENEYPWQVAMTVPGNDDFLNFYCGGSIINNRWILTAAHCEVSTNDQVIVGAHVWNSPPPSKQRIGILSVINHQSYNSDTYDHDIALVQLAEDLDFNDIGLAPVCLPPSGSSNTYAGVKATVTGWGTLAHGSNSWPNELQEVEVDVVTNTDCRNDYSISAITENMICAGIDEGGKDSCQGDSGGPLVTENNGAYTQIGVVSWGNSCADPDYYGVYARVTRYLDWITNIAEVCHQ